MIEKQLPKLFIICSKYSEEDAALLKKYLEGIQRKDLSRKCDVQVWYNPTEIPVGQTITDYVEQSIRNSDFAICMLSPDDIVKDNNPQGIPKRNGEKSDAEAPRTQPRPNVFFELGLSFGSLGRDRTILMCDKTVQDNLPSDLKALITLEYTTAVKGKKDKEAHFRECAQKIWEYIEKNRHGSEWHRRLIGSGLDDGVSVISHCKDLQKYRKLRILPPGETLCDRTLETITSKPIGEYNADKETTWESIWNSNAKSISEIKESGVFFIVDTPRENNITRSVLVESERILVGRTIKYIEDIKEINGTKVSFEQIEAGGVAYRTDKYLKNKGKSGVAEYLAPGTPVGAFTAFNDYLVLMKLPGEVVTEVKHNAKTVWIIYGFTVKGTYAGACMLDAESLRLFESRVKEQYRYRELPPYFEALLKIKATGKEKVKSFINHEIVHFTALNLKTKYFVEDPVPESLLQSRTEVLDISTVPLSSVHLDLVSGCNFNCFYCIEKEACGKKLMLHTSTVLRILMDLHEAGCRDIRLYGGEPTLHPDFAEIMKLISQIGFNVLLVTNGSTLAVDEEGIPLFPVIVDAIKSSKNCHVRVSLDANNNAAHKKNHGIHKSLFTSIVDGIMSLLKAGVSVSISYLLTEHSQEDMEKACEYWHKARAHSFHPRFPMKKHGKGLIRGIEQILYKKKNSIDRRMERLAAKYPGWFIQPCWSDVRQCAQDRFQNNKNNQCYVKYYRLTISPGPDRTFDVPFPVDVIRKLKLYETKNAWISFCSYYRYREEFGCPYPKNLNKWYKTERVELLQHMNSKTLCVGTFCSHGESNMKIGGGL